MKLSFILIFVGSLQLSASVLLGQEVSIQAKASLVDVLEELNHQTGTYFMYNEKDIDDDIQVELNLESASLEEVLNEICNQTPLKYEVIEDFVVITRKDPVPVIEMQQEKKIVTGKVTDENGMSVPGVSVVIKGTTTGVSTDMDGNYSIEVDGDVILVFSFVGMKTQERQIQDKIVLNITLETDEELLGEVMVTGYQSLSKERATAAFTTLTNSKLETKSQINIIDRIEGLVPGLQRGYNNELNIRGVSTLRGGTEPLFVVDGFPIQGGVSEVNRTVNPENIESITVLKDAAAASIWGARSSNGVIVINTKKGKKGKAQFSYSYKNSITEENQISDLAYLKSSDFIDLELETENEDLMKKFFDQYAEIFGSDSPILFSVMSGLVESLKKDEGWDFSPVQDYLNEIYTGNKTREEALAEIDKLRKQDNKEQLQKYLIQRVQSQSHNLAVRGSGNSHNYAISTNYTQSKGVYVGDRSKRFIADIKNEVQLSNWLKLSTNINFSYNKRKGAVIGYQQLKLRPYEMIVDDKGNALNQKTPFFYPYSNSYYQDKAKEMGLYPLHYNLLEEQKANRNTTEQLRSRMQLKLQAKITDDLRWQTGIHYETGNLKNQNFQSKNAFDLRYTVNTNISKDEQGNLVYNVPKGAINTQRVSKPNNLTIRSQIDFNKDLAEGKHKITAIAGGEIRRTTSTGQRLTLYGFDPQYLTSSRINFRDLANKRINGAFLPNGNVTGLTSKDYVFDTENRFLSFYSNASWFYNDKYVLSASARIDQSNLFGVDPKYKYKPLWSVGLTWKLAEESFFEVNWVDRLNIRITQGLNGNVAKLTGPYNIAQTGQNLAYDTQSLSIIYPKNDFLRWESTKTSNIGVDYSLLNNRISGSFDYYYRKSTDILGDKELDPTLGWKKATLNVADLTNRGYEASISSTNIKTKNFIWQSTINYSNNKNTVGNVFTEKSTASRKVRGIKREKGRPYQSIFSFRYAGLDENGDPLLYNAKNEKVPYNEITDEKDVVFSGTVVPVWNASLSNRLNYKGIDLSFLFIASGGNVMRGRTSNVNQFAMYENLGDDLLKRWKKSGDENTTNVPRFSKEFNNERNYAYRNTDIHVLDASYVKLRELTLSYTLSKKIIQKLPLQSIRIYAQGRNLWTWTANNEGIDPESHDAVNGSRTFPIPKTYSFGINVSF
jgi:TonB-linked SusC/RagA family outer membrane protein